MSRQFFVGNDLVDLDLARTYQRSQSLPYLNKVCGPREIEAIKESQDPELTLQALWASKEASFKALVKFDPHTIFAPRSFTWDASLADFPQKIGIIHGKYRIVVSLDIDPGWLHGYTLWFPTMGTGHRDLNLIQTVAPLFGDESLEVRRLALDSLDHHGYHGLQIVNRPPIIQGFQGVIHESDLSLTHDGAWCAVAWCINKTYSLD